jgi:hypothetical protein
MKFMAVDIFKVKHTWNNVWTFGCTVPMIADHEIASPTKTDEHMYHSGFERS